MTSLALQQTVTSAIFIVLICSGLTNGSDEELNSEEMSQV